MQIAMMSGALAVAACQPEPEDGSAGSRFLSILVSEINVAGNPSYMFQFTDPDGNTVDVESPDPGRALVTGSAADANSFKIPTIWGARATAPYFHDNSAGDIPAMLEHHDALFNLLGFDLTAQDTVDIEAYMKLL